MMASSLDVPERIRASLARRLSWLPNDVVAVLAREWTIVYYAFASWRLAPFVPAGAAAYSYHRKSGRVGILYTVAALVVVETLVVDLIMRRQHPTIANVLLVASIASALWIVAFARSVQLRPIALDAHTLALRTGFQWTIDVPRSNIASIEFDRARMTADKTTPRAIRLVTQYNALVTLRAPQEVKGAYGRSRTVAHIAFAVDDIKKLAREFNN